MKAFNLEELIKIRHLIHQNPELAFEEIETGKTIVKYLTETCKIPASSISQGIGKTGIVVNIKGLSEPKGENRCIAFRADMDCLPMPELSSLPYKSSFDGKSHSCGHDGHVTCLLGFAALVSDNLESIPANKTVRLLFQPAEEFCRKNDTGGAKLMVQEGCMEHVDEVYGFHNLPSIEIGHLAVKEGPVMAEISVIKFIVHGKGGHASVPHLSKNPVDAVVECYSALNSIIQKFKSANRQFVMCFPLLHAGTADNVIPDIAELSGNIRSLEEGLSQELLEEIKNTLPSVCEKHGCTIEIIFKPGYPIVNNAKGPTEVVERLGKLFFDDKIVDKSKLPLMAAEDFSFYQKAAPGCFFFIGGKEIENEPYLHTSNYNFKDSNINIVAQFYYEIMKDRFGLN